MRKLCQTMTLHKQHKQDIHHQLIVDHRTSAVVVDRDAMRHFILHQHQPRSTVSHHACADQNSTATISAATFTSIPE